MRTQLAVMVLLAGCSTEQPNEENVSNDNGDPQERRFSPADGGGADPSSTHDAGAAVDASAPVSDVPADAGDAAALSDANANANADDAATLVEDAAAIFDPPAPDGRVGAPCANDEACADLGKGHRCLKEGDLGSPTGYCTRDCDALHAIQCGMGAACVTYNGETQCQRLCTTGADCRTSDGYVCAPFVVFGLCLHPDEE